MEKIKRSPTLQNLYFKVRVWVYTTKHSNIRMTLEYEDFVFNQLFDTSQFRELFNVVLQKPSRSNFYGQSE